jgi:nucleoid-associated protein YgaU
MANKAKIASELFGLGAGGSGLEKLTIQYRYGKMKTGKAEALFNPSEISISRSVRWQRKKVASQGGNGQFFNKEQEFREVEAATLSIELFFDTYESRDAMSWKRAATSLLTPTNPFQKGDASDVRERTDAIVKLAEADRELHQPPICHLAWGAFDIFDGVLTQVDQRFTMFLADGTPVRATLSCSFVEFHTEAHYKAREPHSADVAKTRVVRRNDTLQSIAAEEYNDPSLWRLIARANAIVNPRDLRPGTLLAIPKLRP